ncbi:MAG: pimeloyl-ACP methyl ester carboxylesterase [Candidatus Endobugula sp.]|jgi:pimeloyl-ACP methyl ester carboxylesterase
MSSPSNNFYYGLSNEGFHRNYYREWGDPDSEHTIICVHGVTRLSRDFDTLAEELSKTYRVICPDIVGRGYSDWFGNKQNYNFLQYCADMNALIANLNVEKVHWIGTSMGGLIGLILGALTHTPIQSLILNDVGPNLKRAELQRLGQYIGKAPTFPTKEDLFAYYEKTYAAFGRLPKKQWQEMALYSAFEESYGYRMHYDPKIGDAFRASYSFYNFDLWKYWEDIDCPSLLIRGELSTFFPQEVADKMCQRGSDVQFSEVKNVGHAPMLNSKTEINTIKKFYQSIL